MLGIQNQLTCLENIYTFNPVQTKCYKGIVTPVLEYAAPVWDPHQKHLQDKQEMVERRSVWHICGDFSPTSSAVALVQKLNLDHLQLRRMSYKATMLYKAAGGLINAKPREGTLTQNPTSWPRVQSPHPILQNRNSQEQLLPIGNMSVEQYPTLCPSR